MMDMAFSTLNLHLSNKVLQEVSSENTIAGIWVKLESLYMTKSLQDRIYLKGKFFGFKMSEMKSSSESHDEYNTLILGMDNIGIYIEDEIKPLQF